MVGLATSPSGGRVSASAPNYTNHCGAQRARPIERLQQSRRLERLEWLERLERTYERPPSVASQSTASGWGRVAPMVIAGCNRVSVAAGFGRTICASSPQKCHVSHTDTTNAWPPNAARSIGGPSSVECPQCIHRTMIKLNQLQLSTLQRNPTQPTNQPNKASKQPAIQVYKAT